MTYIKKLVMHGFKSFPRKTELLFTPEINVILGPNGSGKSNISDALCFVLGRLSIKSMRAAKASNLIFLGTKAASPAKEASVEMIFENSDRVFSIDNDEVSVKRIVRKNGQSIYKINGETKTRQDVISLLAQAGIDSYGFNLILQGEIQNFVRMHSEERRKIVEEVSGISIYESRKEKSLKELSKTEEKLKEVVAILRERTSYLNNLEKERQQALRFKRLEKDVKIFKKSIIDFDLIKRKKEIQELDSEVLKKNKETDKIKKSIIDFQTAISSFEFKITSINSLIQKSTGLEQEKLNQEIANLRAEIAGLNVRIDNYENKLSDISKQKAELERLIRENEVSVKELQKESPKAKKQKDIDSKKQEVEELEEQRKKFYTLKSELKAVKDRLEDKKGIFKGYNAESEFLIKQINQLSEEMFDKKTNSDKLSVLKSSLVEKKNLLENLNRKESELEKVSYTNEYAIDRQNKMIDKISKIDVCPVCKSKITEDHVHSIEKEAKVEVDSLKKEIENSDRELNEISKRKEILNNDIREIQQEIGKREADLVKLSSIDEKKDSIKNLQEKIEVLKGEIAELEKTRMRLEKNFDENSNIEQRYETARVELQEISSRTSENLGSEISFKERELERAKISLKQLKRDEEDLREELSENKKNLESKEESLENKREREEELTLRFRKMISDRDDFQKKIRDEENRIVERQNNIRLIEQEVNNFSIQKARLKAEMENLETDLFEFRDVESVKGSRESLINRLESAKNALAKIGSVNLLSLEVYDNVKKEYDSVKDKAEIIEKEKEGILKIIHEIDVKKKKTFLKTLQNLNEIFSRNFAGLNSKGQVSLELDNRKEPFEGGVSIIVKTGHGKYFDVTSLSGGEQTMVALSLIFAIQEFKPYCFYVLDEIDAALDKRNSERLAELLKKYMQKGQYIVITHNDEIITNATNLYGVSMHDGISKVVSMKI